MYSNYNVKLSIILVIFVEFIVNFKGCTSHSIYSACTLLHAAPFTLNDVDFGIVSTFKKSRNIV